MHSIRFGEFMGTLVLVLLGKGGSNWRYAPIPIVGDLAGAALAGLLLHYAHLSPQASSRVTVALSSFPSQNAESSVHRQRPVRMEFVPLFPQE
ncbi:MAG: hypothetical protein ABSC62_11525 [Terracidiphilus sp.]|jgi:hypothetical protein